MYAPEAPEAAQVESNVLSHVAHQLTVEGPSRRVCAYGNDLPSLSHGFIESISLDDLFEKVFGE